jgi:DNA adenine methylase
LRKGLLEAAAKHCGGGKTSLFGKVMVSINDHPDIRRAFEGFHFEQLDIRYSCTNQRQGVAETTGELVIMNWVPAALGGLFDGV